LSSLSFLSSFLSSSLLEASSLEVSSLPSLFSEADSSFSFSFFSKFVSASSVLT
jgi:hypothetical protein